MSFLKTRRREAACLVVCAAVVFAGALYAWKVRGGVKPAMPGPYFLDVITPSRPKPLQPTPITVTVHDLADHAPVTGAAVNAALVMPSMPMPPNQTALSESISGTYRGTLTYTMPGSWRIEIIMHGKKGAAERDVAVDVP